MADRRPRPWAPESESAEGVLAWREAVLVERAEEALLEASQGHARAVEREAFALECQEAAHRLRLARTLLADMSGHD